MHKFITAATDPWAIEATAGAGERLIPAPLPIGEREEEAARENVNEWFAEIAEGAEAETGEEDCETNMQAFLRETLKAQLKVKNAQVRELAERFIEEVAPNITAETLKEEFALPKGEKQHFVDEFAKFEAPVKAKFVSSYRKKVS